ncbi:Y-family DNA polymerase [Aureimonas ureilytica]|uniref:Y-family DNA polymerase n=1 Tax=Aureimonas ureilytica TaxID=401562 RepID=UPI0009EA346E|nr:Y-family DNA polymerase [Aureimonas ureilytica]
MTWALVDVENFYVSSERVFDPALRGVPVLVLSNGDHCAIARSAEAKAFGVKMGAPVFKMRELIKRHGFALRSSNYELYSDMNRRFNAVLSEFSDQIEIYSIDESWFRLPVRADGLGDTATALAVIAKVKRDTGLPTRIGLGPTRTLSKVANGLAKAGEKVFGGVIDLHDVDLRRHLFRNWPVSEVWGIGRALSERLAPLGIRTTADLAAMDPHQARSVGTVVLERLVRELNGVGDDQLVIEPEKRQATAVTRMFGEPVTTIEDLREAMARRAARAAEKIREQGSVAGRLIGFAHGNGRKANAPSAQRSCRLSPPTNDTRVIVRWASRMVESMWQEGGAYTKCGVMLEDLCDAGREQTDLFAATDSRGADLMSVMDAVNSRYGRETLALGTAGIGARSFDTKRAMKSPAWTTRITEIPVAT